MTTSLQSALSTEQGFIYPEIANFKNALKPHLNFHNSSYETKSWALLKLGDLIRNTSSYCEKLDDQEWELLLKNVMSIYELCIPLIIDQGRSVERLADFVNDMTIILNKFIKKKFNPSVISKIKALSFMIEDIAQTSIFPFRNDKLMMNPWSYAIQLSLREVIESVLTKNPKQKLSTYDYPRNPLIESTLWKIIFEDNRTFKLFMRCTESLRHFKSVLKPFLNTMGRLRLDDEAYDSLVRYHYNFIEIEIIPEMDYLGVDRQVKSKILQAWQRLCSQMRQEISGESKLEKETLFKNLYTFKNRRLYPHSLPEKLADVPIEKVNELCSILFNLPQMLAEYKNILCDSDCTRYALKAYLTKKITLPQFTSLCMAWSAIHLYDREMKTTEVWPCDNTSIRHYYHHECLPQSENVKLLLKDSILKKALELTKQSTALSEHFVLVLKFDTSEPLNSRNQLHSSLMKIIKNKPLFLFPNKNHWIVPSFTLMENILRAQYGSLYAKPIVGLGDFVIEDLESALEIGHRPFQINMKGIGNALQADGYLTISNFLLSNPECELNDPSMWLHDLFHLNLLSAIPLTHRFIFLRLAQFIKEKAKNLSENYATAHIKVYKYLIDMQFNHYINASRKDKKNFYHEAFEKCIKEILDYQVCVNCTVEEFMQENEVLLYTMRKDI